jgi:hypothetical protein
MSPDERRRRPRQETPSIKIAIASLDGAEVKRRALRHLGRRDPIDLPGVD